MKKKFFGQDYLLIGTYNNAYQKSCVNGWNGEINETCLTEDKANTIVMSLHKHQKVNKNRESCEYIDDE